MNKKKVWIAFGVPAFVMLFGSFIFTVYILVNVQELKKIEALTLPMFLIFSSFVSTILLFIRLIHNLEKLKKMDEKNKES